MLNKNYELKLKMEKYRTEIKPFTDIIANSLQNVIPAIVVNINTREVKYVYPKEIDDVINKCLGHIKDRQERYFGKMREGTL